MELFEIAGEQFYFDLDQKLIDIVKKYVEWGAGPRASQYLILGAKARAALRGRPQASKEDVDALVQPVLGHRILVNFEAEAERIRAREIIEKILQSVHSKDR